MIVCLSPNKNIVSYVLINSTGVENEERLLKDIDWKGDKKCLLHACEVRAEVTKTSEVKEMYMG